MTHDKLPSINHSEIKPLFERSLRNVREDIADNPYIQEALRVLTVGGYRSAIGCFWNAVVDDLRNKVIYRSLSLFNKSVTVGREMKTYEDFQNYINDEQLIDGAYRVGVIGWEASKVLRHAKETRHIFDGHPKSTDPSIIKVLAMFEDCVKYVLNEPYPSQIIDIDEYLTIMGADTYDRNEVAIANALTELPELYKTELINKLFTAYIGENETTVLRSNIEFATPILWRVLPKQLKIQVVRRVDQVMTRGNVGCTGRAFAFVNMVEANAYLTPTARNYVLKPLIEQLKVNLDNWSVENECVRALEPYASNIPYELLPDYVGSLTHTYVGYVGGSPQYSRIDFYANGAAAHIPQMFEKFDDAASVAFVDFVRSSKMLRRRIEHPVKLSRLRSLGNIVLSKASTSFQEKAFLNALVDEASVEEFFRSL